MIRITISLVYVFLFLHVAAQPCSVSGRVEGPEGAIPYAAISWGSSASSGILSDEQGQFLVRVPCAADTLFIYAIGYERLAVYLDPATHSGPLVFVLSPTEVRMTETVVTGTPLPISSLNSPIRVDVVSRTFLQSIPAASVTEMLGYVNGLQESLNCGVCGTNDIHINGMEGPYTLVLIDGMPVMSSLASVYGLNGIPDHLVDRIEIIKGPSSTVFGSEAMGGVINIITRQPSGKGEAIVFSEYSSHDQLNAGASWSGRLSPRSSLLVSVDLFRNAARIDHNDDGFTDIPVTSRGSAFVKYRHQGVRGSWSQALRLYHEDRFGGQLHWQPSDLGGTTVYGESIVTGRMEWLGQWIGKNNWLLDHSVVFHDQESYYGAVHYAARQQTYFANLSKVVRWNTFVWKIGLTQRLNGYEDNSPVNADELRYVPGLFIQQEWTPGERFTALAGLRADHHKNHGLVWSPQLNVRMKTGDWSALRLNAATGFRLVNLFTEDHAALTGSREVVIEETLEPERSANVSLDYQRTISWGERSFGRIGADVFFTHFSNQIIPDYDEDPALVVYRNLRGFGRTTGGSVNLLVRHRGWNISGGVTRSDVRIFRDGSSVLQAFTPVWSGTGSLTWEARDARWACTWLMNWTGRMRLPEHPLTGESRSPHFSRHNVQLTWQPRPGIRLYIACKNVFDFVQRDPLVAPDRPFSEDFDTSFIYGPMQTRHWVLGVRWEIHR